MKKSCNLFKRQRQSKKTHPNSC